MESTFRDWLDSALVRHGVSRRELARRLADDAPVGDPESYRRNLGRILKGEVKASQPTRDSIQKALGDFTAPSAEAEDSDEAITAELVIVELEAMIAARRREIRNLIRYRRLVASGGAV